MVEQNSTARKAILAAWFLERMGFSGMTPLFATSSPSTVHAVIWQSVRKICNHESNIRVGVLVHHTHLFSNISKQAVPPTG
jgi:hypothetical protein